MSLRIEPATAFRLEALAACFTAAFKGYLAGSFTMEAADLPLRLARWGADLPPSRVLVREDGEPMGFVFVGVHGRVRRVGVMGLRPELRGTGASRALLQCVIDEARQAGSQALELEVFAQNTPALRLYRSMGFVEGAPLWGFVREPGPIAGTSVTPRPLSLVEAADWLASNGPADLPYQVSASSLRHITAAQAWQWGRALMVFNETAEPGISMPALVDADGGQRDAAQLLHALVAAFPGHTIRVPQLMRDDVAAQALRDAGFAVLPLHQLQMRLVL
ncbi:MAG TPA: GNAT family N-acetyltransferase [Albitalea sp.]|uniref:GNAT family N-acetyltransferase n=1 Tax=Piscinibacter sp. TaxID=1903157 RepID=UPI002ECFE955